MKKSRKRRAKRKSRTLLALSLLVILAVSTVGALIIYFMPGNSAITPTPSPSSTPGPSPTITPSPSSTPSPSPTITPSPSSTPSPSPTPTPNPSRPNITLNKQIPPGYTMGFTVDAELLTGMQVVFLQNSNEKISIRFTAKMSGNVAKIVIYAFAYQEQPTIRVGLQEDNSNAPAGIWMNENAYGVLQLDSENSFKTFQLGTQAFLTEGQVYHIVIEAAENPLNGIAAIRTYRGSGFAQPSNPEDPDLIWNDPQMNVLTLSDNDWNQQNKWSVFVVGYSDGNLEGQPYSLCAQWVVWGSTYVGQSIIPASDYTVGKIAFDVTRGSGNPQDSLYYQILDDENLVLSEGFFASSSQLTTSQTWVEATLTTSVTLKAGKLYRIVLLSPETDYDNAYYLFGHEFCYDPIIGYGSLQHQLTSSLTEGNYWSDNKDADAIFAITTAD